MPNTIAKKTSARTITSIISASNLTPERHHARHVAERQRWPRVEAIGGVAHDAGDVVTR